MTSVVVTYLVYWMVVGGCGGLLIAAAMHKPRVSGFVVGALLGVFGWLLILVSKGNVKKCPRCGEQVQKSAVVCRFCRCEFATHDEDDRDSEQEQQERDDLVDDEDEEVWVFPQVEEDGESLTVLSDIDDALADLWDECAIDSDDELTAQRDEIESKPVEWQRAITYLQQVIRRIESARPNLRETVATLGEAADATAEYIGILARLTPTSDEQVEAKNLDAAEDRFDEHYGEFAHAMKIIDPNYVTGFEVAPPTTARQSRKLSTTPAMVPIENKPSGAAQPAASTSTVAELERLADLRARGALTEEEFTAAKRKVLDTPGGGS